MKTTKIYLGHALANASKEFLQEMQELRLALKSIEGVETLDFAWIFGKGTDESVTNVFEHDIKHVESADLMIAVWNENVSTGLAMEIMRRCEINKPLKVFVSPKVSLSRMISGCIEHYQKQSQSQGSPKNLYEVSSFVSNKNVADFVVQWKTKEGRV